MTSNKDDWVRGVALLISSVSSILAKAGPDKNSNSLVLGFQIYYYYYY
jgi:hypothetical protein